jgi:hypothetical protein
VKFPRAGGSATWGVPVCDDDMWGLWSLGPIVSERYRSTVQVALVAEGMMRKRGGVDVEGVVVGV